jgi:hypothetical protein
MTETLLTTVTHEAGFRVLEAGGGNMASAKHLGNAQ